MGINEQEYIFLCPKNREKVQKTLVFEQKMSQNEALPLPKAKPDIDLIDLKLNGETQALTAYACVFRH